MTFSGETFFIKMNWSFYRNKTISYRNFNSDWFWRKMHNGFLNPLKKLRFSQWYKTLKNCILFSGNIKISVFSQITPYFSIKVKLRCIATECYQSQTKQRIKRMSDMLWRFSDQLVIFMSHSKLDSNMNFGYSYRIIFSLANTPSCHNIL